jgi:hypothetical protein
MLSLRRHKMLVTTSQSIARSRSERYNDCIAAAAAGGYIVPAGQAIMIFTSPSIDLFAYVGIGAKYCFEGVPQE